MVATSAYYMKSPPEMSTSNPFQLQAVIIPCVDKRLPHFRARLFGCDEVSQFEF